MTIVPWWSTRRRRIAASAPTAAAVKVPAGAEDPAPADSESDALRCLDSARAALDTPGGLRGAAMFARMAADALDRLAHAADGLGLSPSDGLVVFNVLGREISEIADDVLTTGRLDRQGLTDLVATEPQALIGSTAADIQDAKYSTVHDGIEARERLRDQLQAILGPTTWHAEFGDGPPPPRDDGLPAAWDPTDPRGGS
ncbi:MAG: hypothetical protein LC798_11970 [Chloroflexi bacterium]|nr:hypothetical protein [Chloroflexota bacterium]